MTRALTHFALALALTLAAAVAARAQGFETAARAAIVIDHTTGTVLMEKNADEPLPPASMSKLMTLYMAFEAIADGRLTIDEELLVSQHAMDYGGSSMFLRAGERVRVEDLIRGIVVLSGNDASTVVAEALSPDGTELGFARMMTERAQQLGMVNSTFMNANGWPAAGQRMSVRDLAILADRLITDFPTFYPLFAETEFPFDGRVPSNTLNRNPILSLGLGADGLKTGHTQEAGFGLVGSAKQGDRRIIFVITGLDTEGARREESERILNWAFRQFVERDLGRAGAEITRAAVWLGAERQVGLTLADDLRVLMPVLAGGGGITAEAVYDAPVAAPVAAGQALGTLVIAREGLPEMRVPLVADRDIGPAGFVERLRTAAFLLLGRVAPQADLEAIGIEAPAGLDPALGGT